MHNKYDSIITITRIIIPVYIAIIISIMIIRYMPSMDEQFTVFNIPGVHITHPTTGVCIIIITRHWPAGPRWIVRMIHF